MFKTIIKYGPVHGTSRLNLGISAEGLGIFHQRLWSSAEEFIYLNSAEKILHPTTKPTNARPNWALCPAESACLQNPVPSLLSVTTLHHCQGDLCSLRAGNWIWPMRLQIWVFSYCWKSTVRPISMTFMPMCYMGSVKMDHSLRKILSLPNQAKCLWLHMFPLAHITKMETKTASQYFSRKEREHK